MAVHRTVAGQLAAWRAPGSHCAEFVARLDLLLERCLAGDQTSIQMLVRAMRQEGIYGVDGLRELGPKKKQGGAPRAFYLREHAGTFLVAAGMETGTGGAQEIDVAKARARAILASPEALTDENVRRNWAAEYGIRFGVGYNP